MNMFLSGNANINDVSRTTILSDQRGAKESSTTQNGNTIHKPFISCTIIRNYIEIIGPLPVNLGVHITRSAIKVPPVVLFGPNDSIGAGYVHATSKLIISLTI